MKKVIMMMLVAAAVTAANAEEIKFVTLHKEGTNTISTVNTLQLNRVNELAAIENDITTEIVVKRHCLGLTARMFGAGAVLDKIIERRNRINLPSLEEIVTVENVAIRQKLLTQWYTLTSEEEIQKQEKLLEKTLRKAEEAKKKAEEIAKKAEAEKKAQELLKKVEAKKAKTEKK